MATLPRVVPYSGPVRLTVVSTEILKTWAHAYPGAAITFLALEGLVNRQAPQIFAMEPAPELHDQDWLNLLVRDESAQLITQPDSTNRIDDLTWYLSQYKPNIAGYILFNSSDQTSIDVALSLSGVLNAIPISSDATALLQAAQQTGLTQLEDARNRDYSWLKSSQYWASLNRDAIYLNHSKSPEGADYAVSEKMAMFSDDPRNDPQMNTMASMLSDQHPGGIVFGWGYTDGQYAEDYFVGQASRYDLGVMDIPANVSVFMHFPGKGPMQQNTTPPLPSDTRKHYVAFVYSDGDNPRVMFGNMTKPDADRYASPLRGTIPIGWTIPPTMPGFAAPVLDSIAATATPDDEFVAGPSGYGYMFPSLIPDKPIYATQTGTCMNNLGLHDATVFDENGNDGFTHASLDALTAQSGVNSVYYVSFDGQNQPAQGQILWSNGKPVIPVYTLVKPGGQPNADVISPLARYINGLSTDDSSAAAYTLVYLDFWSISMTEVSSLVHQFGSDVEVVRPDVLSALLQQNVRH